MYIFSSGPRAISKKIDEDAGGLLIIAIPELAMALFVGNEKSY